MVVAARRPRVGVAEAVLDVFEGDAGVAGEGGVGVAQHVGAHGHRDAGVAGEPA